MTKKNSLSKLEQTGNLTIFAGLLLAYWHGVAQSRQGEFIILAGLCLTVGVFDQLVLLILRNKDPSKSSPSVFPLVIALLVMLILFPFYTATSAIQYYKAQDNVSYAVKKNVGIVRRVYGGDAAVVLADSYKDVPISVIEKRALASRKNMKTVDLPEELKEIRASAFTACKGLTELELPDGLEVIGKSAFSQCTSLKRITIPASVTEIPKSAFNGCPKDMVIVGEPYSAAQVYAEKYFTFEALSP